MTEHSSSAKQPLAFRVRPTTLEHLRRRAHETGQTQTDLAERYLEEGLRMDEHPLIHFRGGAGGRRAALVGTRLDVWQAMETVEQHSRSVEDAADYLEISVEQVRAAVRYYAAYTDEIDRWAARVSSVVTREETAWRRQQAVLG